MTNQEKYTDMLLKEKMFNVLYNKNILIIIFNTLLKSNQIRILLM